MRAWVTGAAGFIGRHLVRHLADAGTEISGLDLAPEPAVLADKVSSWAEGRLSQRQLASLASDRGKPDVVFHLAGGASVGRSLLDPIGDYANTVEGTANLLDWLRTDNANARLVLVSSAAVYGNLHSGRIAENAATAPFSPYGAHKLAMEMIARGWAGSFGLQAVAVRLFSVYGPGLRKQLLWDLCGKLAAGEPRLELGGSGEELRDWTHIDDVVRALAAAVPFASREVPIVNAGTGIPTTVCRIAELVTRVFGRDPGSVSFDQHSREGDPFSLVAGAETLEAAGFEWNVGLENGVADYVQWFKMQREQ